MRYRSVQLGVIAISIASITILLLTMVFFYRVQQQENNNISRITTEQRNTMVDNILELKLMGDMVEQIIQIHIILLPMVALLERVLLVKTLMVVAVVATMAAALVTMLMVAVGRHLYRDMLV